MKNETMFIDNFGYKMIIKNWLKLRFSAYGA